MWNNEMKILEKVYLHKPQSRDNLYKSGYYYPAKHADAEIARLKELMLEAAEVISEINIETHPRDYHYLYSIYIKLWEAAK